MAMKRMRTSVITLLFALAGWLPVSAQQRHVADQATLDQVIADHLRQRADDRETIRRVLEMQQVRKLAEGVGLDLIRAERAVATLDDAEVAVLATQARAVNDALVGGQSTVTISTTAIIIGLLVLILLIVAT
jgi:hypothetical protein